MWNTGRTSVFCVLIGFLATDASRASDVGWAFTYQGFLNNGGTPVDATCTFDFSLWDAPIGGTEVGELPISSVPLEVANGFFDVLLDFGPEAINGLARWMEIQVQCPGDVSPILLTPRVELTPVPHALALPGLYTQQNVGGPPNIIAGYSGNSTGLGGAVGATIGGGGNNDGPNIAEGIYSVIAGGWSNQSSGPMASIGGGHLNVAPGDSSTVGGGLSNAATNGAATVSGGQFNAAHGGSATVGGGFGNAAWGTSSIVGGGEANSALGDWSTISGGIGNIASAGYTTVGGGQNNFAIGDTHATVSGGQDNDASAAWATVGGGLSNAGSGLLSTIAGGQENTASGSRSAVGGGEGNTVIASWSAIGGGYRNTIGAIRGAIAGGGEAPASHTCPGFPEFGTCATCSGGPYVGTPCLVDGECGLGGVCQPNDGMCQGMSTCVTEEEGNRVLDNWGFIGGGGGNTAGEDDLNIQLQTFATVGGGVGNTASAAVSTIAGGSGNKASGSAAFVGGGAFNVASGRASVVAGGNSNTALGNNAMVLGGSNCSAGGDNSFAGGNLAHVRSASETGDADGDENTFLWDDHSGSLFSSTGPNQFLIRASGGVGIGTNAPSARLHVLGGTDAGLANDTGTVVVGSVFSTNRNIVMDGDEIQARSNAAAADLLLNPAGGDVGIGVAAASAHLHVSGTTGSAALFANNDSTLNDATVRITNSNAAAIALWADVTSSDATMVLGNDGTGSIIRAFGNHDPCCPVFRVEANGWVGINSTTAPTRPLTIQGDGGNSDYLQFRTSAGVDVWHISNQGPGLNFVETGVSANRLVLAPGGNVGIGDSSPDVALDVIGDINYTGIIIDVSDERLKENVAPLLDALKKVQRLDGVYFNMKDTPDQRDVGYIAQNVQEILPEAVRVIDADNGFLGVSYTSVIPLLSEAIKELHAEHNARVTQLEQDNADLKARLATMEKLVAELVTRKAGE